MSKILALEWSSRRLSVAWSRDGKFEERVIEATRFRVTEALSLLEECGDLLKELTEIRIGRGPGNYTGVRQALSWAIGFAAPGGIRLTAISSGRAQARRLLENEGGEIAILGDARRGKWWGTQFPTMQAEWRLQSPADWLADVEGMKVFSPEAERLRTERDSVVLDYPQALDLLRFPEESATEELAPCYLHPAVNPL
ncbi:MAG: tRNA (adenosine(37)-N6)-threonylcarbamoyltransferase complex dimerization subunit type 1 TsaB [Kiritimatiellae bacterium]|jgi:tRNA threonylcarbamoyl adenosine modification protein YeaZ|nr:tRNA (adenosine(37)-N6)-threonylcarbamoyltransferase complex dimerization subunit type 1 TsaB [Kiritimatiellia bacterium]